MTASRQSHQQAPPPLLVVLSAVAALILAAPAAYLIIRNFTADADPFGLLMTDVVQGPLRRTIVLATLVSVSAGVLGTGLAWLTTRTDLPFRRLFSVLLVLPLVYPTFIGAAAFVRTLNPGGLLNDALSLIGLDRSFTLSGLFGAWLVLTLLTYPYVFLPVAARFSRLPGSIEQSARLLGNSSWRVFARIIVPQAFGAIAAGMLLVFLYAISDFGAVAILRYDTLTRAIENNQLANRPVALALSLVLLMLAGLVVLAERWAQRRRPTQTTSRIHTTAAALSLGRGKGPALLIVSAVTLMALIAPLLALIEWSVRGLLTQNRTGRRMVVDAADIFEVTWHTLAVSALAAVTAVLIVLPIAVLAGRYKSRVGTLGHAVAISTFALPGILIALAGTFFIRQTDWTFSTFNSSFTILIFAYTVRFAALAMGTTLVSVSAVPDRLRDVSESLGASPLRRFTRIDIPLMTPGLLAAAGLVLLSTMKELPISLLLRPIEFDTLATRIFSTFSESFVTEAGLMGLTLVALSFMATWTLIIRPLSKQR